MINGEVNIPVALITGAAGGFGQALTAAFVSQGWRVAAGFHRAPVEEGNFIHAVPLDVTSRASVEQAVEKILSHGGRIDALINNAGVIPQHRETTVDGFEMQFAVNHLAYFLLTGLLLEQIGRAHV